MLRTPARILGHHRYLKIPLAGWLFRAAGMIPVKPGDRDSGRAALAAIQDSLQAGTPVVVFPEGDLFPDAMSEFRNGAFVAAKRARVPIVPVLLEGMGQAWRPGTLVVKGRHELRIAADRPYKLEN
jgi:1-acyl-sn-glycerol-3-phosphate acyltransferase